MNDPTRQERRAEREAAKFRKVLDNRRSVFLLQRLSQDTQRRRRLARRKVGAK